MAGWVSYKLEGRWRKQASNQPRTPGFQPTNPGPDRPRDSLGGIKPGGIAGEHPLFLDPTVPSGTADNSPAIYCRGCRVGIRQVPLGTTEIKGPAMGLPPDLQETGNAPELLRLKREHFHHPTCILCQRRWSCETVGENVVLKNHWGNSMPRCGYMNAGASRNAFLPRSVGTRETRKNTFLLLFLPSPLAPYPSALAPSNHSRAIGTVCL